MRQLVNESFEVAALADIGPRFEQQDSVYIHAGPGRLSALFAVSDGHGPLGGCSEDVVSIFAEAVARALETFPESDIIPTEAIFKILREAVEHTDEEICLRLRRNVERILQSWLASNSEAEEALSVLGEDFFHAELSSGATMTALLQIEGAFYITHVGDSQAFLLDERHEEPQSLTIDHNWKEDEDTEVFGGVVYKHDLAVARAFGHPRLKKKNFLTSIPDISRLEDIQRGDAFVLASDGILALLEDRGLGILTTALKLPTPRSAALKLIQSVQDIATDNVSVIVIRYRDPDAVTNEHDPITEEISFGLHEDLDAVTNDFTNEVSSPLDDFPTSDLSQTVEQVRQRFFPQAEQATLELDIWEEELAPPPSRINIPTPTGNLPKLDPTEDVELPAHEREHLISPYAAAPSDPKASSEASIPKAPQSDPQNSNK
ncbi:MAG: protein serine/threonine phosphatase 2C family protein [Myxococcales bacterium]|nr:protein serine/threonine phosphatase 2C family protein [Myxococcales bacterium]